MALVEQLEKEMIVGRWYVQLAVIWHWCLLLVCVCVCV